MSGPHWQVAAELCLEIGCPHPDYLPLDGRQLEEWFAYHDLAPFGERRKDLRMGVLFWAMLAPHVSFEGAAPSTQWPYWESGVVLDAHEVMAQEAALNAYMEAQRRGQDN